MDATGYVVLHSVRAVCSVDDDATLCVAVTSSRQPVQRPHFPDDLDGALQQHGDNGSGSGVDEESGPVTAGITRPLESFRQDGAPGAGGEVGSEHPDDGSKRRTDYGSDSDGIVEPKIGTKDGTDADREVPPEEDLSGVEDRRVDKGGHQARSPVTVCHVRVTVRHRRSPGGDGAFAARGGAGTVRTGVGDSTPAVPALRRAGAPSKRASPAPRRVTFSPTVDDRRRPVLAGPVAAAASAAPVDTLWHYHESYPATTRQVVPPPACVVVVVPSAAVGGRPAGSENRAPSTHGNENENGNVPPRSLDAATSRAAEAQTASTRQRHPALDDQQCHPSRNHRRRRHQQADQRDMSAADNYSDEAESGGEEQLSIRQLVASFESMTCPFMRPPVVATHRITTD